MSKIKNLNNLTIEAQDAEVTDIPVVEQSETNPNPEVVPIVKKNWFERRAEAAYAKRVERAEKKLQKAKEQPPKKSFREKVNEAKPKILKGAAIVGGVGAAIVGGAIAYNAQRANSQESSDGIQDGVLYDLDTMEPEMEEPAEIEVKTEEAQEA